MQFGFSSGGLEMIFGYIFPGLEGGREGPLFPSILRAGRGPMAAENKVRQSTQEREKRGPAFSE